MTEEVRDDEFRRALSDVLRFRAVLGDMAREPNEKWVGVPHETTTIGMPVSVRKPEIGDFAEALSDLLANWSPACPNYLKLTQDILLNSADTTQRASLIATLDSESVKAILTFAIRGERFADGHIASLLQNGMLECALDRLKVLFSNEDIARMI